MRRRVIRSQLALWFDPEVVFSTLYGTSDRAFWLDSGVAASAGFSYLGEGIRLVTASAITGLLEYDPPLDPAPSCAPKPAQNIFEFLASRQGDVAVATGGGFQLGWVGWFGYELRTTTMESRQPSESHNSRFPDAAWLEVVRAIEFDHAARTVTLVALGSGNAGDDWTGAQAEWRDAIISALTAQRLAAGSTGASTSISSKAVLATPEVRWAHSDAEYLSMIRQCQAAIANGNAYQLCLTTQVTVDIRPDPRLTYLALRALSPAHHGGFLRAGKFALLSSSPESFLSVTADGAIETRPIKGTRRRGDTRQTDAALRAELLASDKERAENLMIVDLMRNDLARVSEIGSVIVPDLLTVESYAQVHQLVSTVQGRLRRGLKPMDVVVACFPAGSMTGAPKSSATTILDRLEGRARGVYSGAFGYLGLNGAIELAMVIRSIILDGNGATIGTGGGITALSVPDEELEEVGLKAAALLRVLGVSGS